MRKGKAVPCPLKSWSQRRFLSDPVRNNEGVWNGSRDPAPRGRDRDDEMWRNPGETRIVADCSCLEKQKQTHEHSNLREAKIPKKKKKIRR